MSGRIHHYQAACSWTGSTAAGYEAYPRNHSATAAPAEAQLQLSGDPAFRGDATKLNPEQLVVLAASSCQLLSFLAVAARARIDVRAYQDAAEAVMSEEVKPARFVSIALRPKITLAKGPTEERVRHLVHQAHKECYIANSLNFEVTVEPELTFV
jgi:organic hydroperoxide reductase OsmC/OhrA